MTIRKRNEKFDAVLEVKQVKELLALDEKDVPKKLVLIKAFVVYGPHQPRGLRYVDDEGPPDNFPYDDIDHPTAKFDKATDEEKTASIVSEYLGQEEEEEQKYLIKAGLATTCRNQIPHYQVTDANPAEHDSKPALSATYMRFRASLLEIDDMDTLMKDTKTSVEATMKDIKAKHEQLQQLKSIIDEELAELDSIKKTMQEQAQFEANQQKKPRGFTGQAPGSSYHTQARWKDEVGVWARWFARWRLRIGFNAWWVEKIQPI
ncbi:hypothetical protein PT974_08387 [Cladobotryum mycophilum]|uniref:Uncharacterized protein n=1 Tax=Cladobotryum mycophilum TaxID=491253 RepID=A0ABR0SE50_9HYPO